MEKILTIVIPAYNMEKFLSYCLDSLLIGPGLEDVEVLVVNDGSADRTSDIAHGYEERFPEVFRVIDKENGNYGSCVNRGLKEATGKYVKILDADDSFDTDNFGTFISFLAGTDADLVVSDFDIVDENRALRKAVRYALPTGTRYLEEMCAIPAFMEMQMHGVAYRRDKLRKIGYVQTEGISYTDHEWITVPMMAVRTVSYFDKPVYRYLVGREGQTMDPAVKARRVTHIARCALSMCREYERLKNRVTAPLRSYLYGKMLYMIKEVYVFCFLHYSSQNRAFLRRFDDDLKNTSCEMYQQAAGDSGDAHNYICLWRRHPGVNATAVRLLSRCYMQVVALKNNMKR